MIKTPQGNKFWISPDGESVNGPYTLAQIANMHKFEPMGPQTPMQAEGAATWSTLGEWLPETREASRAAAATAAASEKAAQKGPAKGDATSANVRKLVIGLVLALALALAAVYVFFVL